MSDTLKKNLLCILVSLGVMFAIPWGIANFISGDKGMSAYMTQHFAINPITAIGVGVFAGHDIKKRWFQPLLLPALYILGAVLFLSLEPAFLIYAGIYLEVGVIVMLISTLVKFKKDERAAVEELIQAELDEADEE